LKPTFRLRFAVLLLILGIGLAGLPACNSQKTGCPINEEAGKSNVNKKGELSSKKGKSNLFPKKMR
jgi:hypothetical protein